MRNNVHNNGVYFDEDGEDRLIDWCGNPYHFRHGYRVAFVDRDFIFNLADSLRTLFGCIVEDSELQGVTHQITDPFTHICE